MEDIDIRAFNSPLVRKVLSRIEHGLQEGTEMHYTDEEKALAIILYDRLHGTNYNLVAKLVNLPSLTAA